MVQRESDLMHLQARRLRNQGDLQQALTQADAAIRLNDLNMEGYLERVAALIGLGQNDKAVLTAARMIQRVIQHHLNLSYMHDALTFIAALNGQTNGRYQRRG
eukprot:TRINITY_DN16978_c0_g1::TRINITY_DN16978_c0_g1_i1::g.13142::m.13142 TRINITY_DN16978_c0_g1::TRINITY_DN16978_c0_g1_i1::g.13142  ORF type:complete len:103 (+),score=3.49,TPR_11/PF13414.1/5.5e-07,TPR_16/PF13432.1/4.2e-05,TPR_2/PF07719.12/0.017,TPR_2/PF07719.12/1.3e+03,TPR_14/PF13428.1/0.79,TPR_14/PF13428.1/1.4,TPR_19/PF14559.1/0.012 TRINITY_DN16978_c0_g1_i1:289-597(+)